MAKPSSKKELLAQEVSKLVGAGRAVHMDTVDFSDPNRPKTCLEVDFPILRVNQIAIHEATSGAAKKPIYQMSKWWARRQSCIFRAILLAAGIKVPENPNNAAKLVWDVYYANHQKKGAFKQLKVADIFMGGGTTLVEGSRLGMQMFGNDLNPVAWFVTKQEFAKVSVEEVKALLADIEAEVKPQIMPFFACDGPKGEKGVWTHKPTGKVTGADFDPLSLKIEERKDYSYEGPEIIYTFWAKHGPCQVTGCGHRTPIMTTPVISVKTLTVKTWEHTCTKCSTDFDIEDAPARMAPDVPCVVAATEKPFAVLDPKTGVKCPNCGQQTIINLGKGQNKKVELTLLVHPQWLAGAPKCDEQGRPFGGSAQDGAESTVRWNNARAEKIRLVEVRGELPHRVTCPETGESFYTDERGGTAKLGTEKFDKQTGEMIRDSDGAPLRNVEKSSFECRADGKGHDILNAIKATGKTGPISSFVVQGYAPIADKMGEAYNGRFFTPFNLKQAQIYNAAVTEWESRKNLDLKDYWPIEELSKGWKTHGWSIPEHGFTHYWTMFNARQLLVQTQILKAIMTVGNHSWMCREFALGAFQQYLRNENMFCFWHERHDMMSPHFSNNNYHPKSSPIENNVFGKYGYGNWYSCIEGILEGKEWAENPWDSVSVASVKTFLPSIEKQVSSKCIKVFPNDIVQNAVVSQGSSTDLSNIQTGEYDLVITDPPFGEIMQYAELGDFFYVWLRLALKDKYPEIFAGVHSPKSLEVVTNPYREPNDPSGFYQKLLTECWREAERILKPAGILAFTFHHSGDAPWVSVLESLFEAGFYLEATYPIRSDETKGEGQFGAQKVEYDIIHVCRKRTQDQKPVSWARMRREVLADVQQIQAMLENHLQQGVPAADLQVIRRGKALEYFSRHYGKVYVDDERTISVKEALVGIHQILDDSAAPMANPPPGNAEPATRQFLQIFYGKTEVPRDQMQKYLRGSGMTPDEFVDRNWCSEKSKVFYLTAPLDFARSWSGRHRRNITFDLDQALLLVGACVDGSGINASDTLKNENFKPHPALKGLLEWFAQAGPTPPVRTAAARALTLYNSWAVSQTHRNEQMAFLFDEVDV